MKSLLLVICCCTFYNLAQGRNLKQLPEYLQKYNCKASDPDYEKCVLKGFQDARPFFLKGIPELGFPALEPFRVQKFAVNSTISNLVKIDAVCENAEITGLANTVIQDLKADPIKHYGEIRLFIPWMYTNFDYDVKGQLLVIPLESKGHFEGNFTDTQVLMKGDLKTYLKDGEEYFKTNKLYLKARIGNGWVKLTSKQKEFQYAADIITDFYNENPRRVMDAINPIFVQYAKAFARQEMDQVLSKLPAAAWLPK
ncbi:unnamed protein product [Diabrotica balteata]|uniref:Uncharacterized protein n=1 Tax=Diabrotica balteata TaxID=107213 RepID=A0A9N9T3H7_DIABA|nr:unnamed protein product [Diabrotica balteata]